MCSPAYSPDTVQLHFLADPENPFRRPMVSKILTREGDDASIPCLATDPSLHNLSLEICTGRALASGLQYSPSLQKGIVIHNTQKTYEGCYVCTGTLMDKQVRSTDYILTVKPGKKENCACYVWGSWSQIFCFFGNMTQKCWFISIQCLLLLLQSRCNHPEEWFLRGMKVCPSPVTPLMSIVKSTWSGSPHLARWDPFASSLFRAVLFWEDSARLEQFLYTGLCKNTLLIVLPDELLRLLSVLNTKANMSQSKYSISDSAIPRTYFLHTESRVFFLSLPVVWSWERECKGSKFLLSKLQDLGCVCAPCGLP